MRGGVVQQNRGVLGRDGAFDLETFGNVGLGNAESRLTLRLKTWAKADGSINPQFPRIERHGVNTEVRVGNLDVQAVSEYRANSRVGMAERRR